jgi:hypothetical protein
MIGDGIENCVRYIHKFDPEKSDNPFGYVTLMLFRTYIRRIELEGTQSYVKHKLLNSVENTLDAQELDKEDRIQFGSMLDSMNNQKSSDIIVNFESKLDRRRAKQKLKAAEQ